MVQIVKVGSSTRLVEPIVTRQWCQQTVPLVEEKMHRVLSDQDAGEQRARALNHNILSVLLGEYPLC